MEDESEAEDILNLCTPGCYTKLLDPRKDSFEVDSQDRTERSSELSEGDASGREAEFHQVFEGFEDLRFSKLQLTKEAFSSAAAVSDF